MSAVDKVANAPAVRHDLAQLCPVGAKDFDCGSPGADGDNTAALIDGNARRGVEKGGGCSGRRAQDRIVVRANAADGRRVLAVAGGRALDCGRKRAVGVEYLQAVVAGIGDEYAVVWTRCDPGRVRKLARPAPLAAEREGGRAVRVEHVHESRPRLGYDDSVERVDGNAGADGQVVVRAARRPAVAERAEGEIHARRPAARLVADGLEDVDHGHAAKVFKACRHVAPQELEEVDQVAVGRDSVHYGHPARRVGRDGDRQEAGVGRSWDRPAVDRYIGRAGCVHVVQVCGQMPDVYEARMRIVRRVVWGDKGHGVQPHDGLGRAVRVFLLPLGVELGHGERGAASEHGADDVADAGRHGVAGAGGGVAGRRQVVQGRGVVVGKVPQGGGDGPFQLFADALYVGQEVQLQVNWLYIASAPLVLPHRGTTDAPFHVNEVPSLQVNEPAVVYLHDRRPVDQVGHQVGDPLAPRASGVGAREEEVNNAAVKVEEARLVLDMVRKLVQYDPPIRRVVVGARRVAVEEDQLYRGIVSGQVDAARREH